MYTVLRLTYRYVVPARELLTIKSTVPAEMASSISAAATGEAGVITASEGTQHLANFER